MIGIVLWRRNDWHLKFQSILIALKSQFPFNWIIFHVNHITKINVKTFTDIVEFFMRMRKALTIQINTIMPMSNLFEVDALIID